MIEDKAIKKRLLIDTNIKDLKLSKYTYAEKSVKLFNDIENFSSIVYPSKILFVRADDIKYFYLFSYIFAKTLINQSFYDSYKAIMCQDILSKQITIEDIEHPDTLKRVDFLFVIDFFDETKEIEDKITSLQYFYKHWLNNGNSLVLPYYESATQTINNSLYSKWFKKVLSAGRLEY